MENTKMNKIKTFYTNFTARFNETYKDIVEEWSEVTTIHGCYEISKARSWIVKLMWAVLLLVSIIVCIYCKVI